MGRKADRQIAKSAKATIRSRMPSNWTLLPKPPPAVAMAMATGHCSDAKLLVPITEVELSGHRKILIRGRRKTFKGIKGAKEVAGTELYVMWDSMRNVDRMVAECARGHDCPNIVCWYVALVRRLAQHPDAADSSRIWAAKILLDRENSGINDRL
jgi:hypothetical protein